MDLRVDHILFEHKLEDKSFTEKDTPLNLLFGTNKYSKQEVKDIWFSGIKYGIELGLTKASLEGQRIELNNNTINPLHKEFLEKFYKLAAEYNCGIQYHPKFGMTCITRLQKYK